MEKIKKIFDRTIARTEKNNIAVLRGNIPEQYFYGEHAEQEAEQYIYTLARQGEIRGAYFFRQ
jgi:hypothetical protein